MHAHICNSPTGFYKRSRFFPIAESTLDPYNDQVQCVALSNCTEVNTSVNYCNLLTQTHSGLFWMSLCDFMKEVDILSDRSKPDGTFCIALDLQTQGLILK